MRVCGNELKREIVNTTIKRSPNMRPYNMCTIAFVFTFYVFMCVNALKGENKKHGENKRKNTMYSKEKELIKEEQRTRG